MATAQQQAYYAQAAAGQQYRAAVADFGSEAYQQYASGSQLEDKRG